MPRSTPKPGPDWPAVRRAYETSTDTVADIAARFHLPRHHISRRARLEGWTLRPSGSDMLRLVRLRADARRLEAMGGPLETAIEDVVAALPDPVAPETKGQMRGVGSQTHRRQLVRRFFTVLDLKIQELEKRVEVAHQKATAAKPSLTAGADSERDTRMMAQALKLYGNLCDTADGPSKTNPNASTDAPADAEAVENLRADLRDRIARIYGQPAAPAAPAARAEPAALTAPVDPVGE
jgi:hypothetical protein